MRRPISSKRCAEPLSLGQCGDRSVDVDGSKAWTTVSFQYRLLSMEFLQNFSEGVLLKSLALLFVVWAFSLGHGHISNSSIVAQLQQADRWPLPPSNWWGSLFFGLWPTPPSYPWFRIHIPLPPCVGAALTINISNHVTAWCHTLQDA